MTGGSAIGASGSATVALPLGSKNEGAFNATRSLAWCGGNRVGRRFGRLQSRTRQSAARPRQRIPAEARAQLVPEAEIIKVEKQTYGETYVYRVWFQLNGKTESVDLNTASVSSPHAVFE